MEEQKVWTREEIEKMLDEKQIAVERGILAIYSLQTADEQQEEHTKYSNGVGFSAADDSYLSYIARWLKSGRHLSGYHKEKATQRIKKYAQQLTMIANGDLQKGVVH